MFPTTTTIDLSPLEHIRPLNRDFCGLLERLCEQSRCVWRTDQLQNGETWWYEYRCGSPDKLTHAVVDCVCVMSPRTTISCLTAAARCSSSHAPVIKLPPDCDRRRPPRLLGLLNSSTACFWMKQVFHNKGGDGIGGGIAARSRWERVLSRSTATKLEAISRCPTETAPRIARSSRLGCATSSCRTCSPADDRAARVPYATSGCEDGSTWARRRSAQMIALQEELDWQCYRLYGLIDEDLDMTPEPPTIQARPAGIRDRAWPARWPPARLQTTWFERHGSTPITELPADWPEDYRQLVERRIALIESDPNIAPDRTTRIQTPLEHRAVGIAARTRPARTGSSTVSKATSTSMAA